MQSTISNPEKPALSPSLGLFFGILAVSTASIFIRFAQDEAPSLVIAAYRMTLAAVVLAPYAFQRRNEIRSINKRSISLLILAGIFLAVHFASWITSLELTSVASSVVLVTTTPLWVAIVSPFILHERVTPIIWVGLAVALLGAVIVGIQDNCGLDGMRIVCSGETGGQPLQGNFLAILGAWMAAGYITVGRQVRANLSLVTYTFCVYGTAAILLLILVALNGLPMTNYTPATYGWLVALAIVPQLIGHSVFNWALRYLPAAYVSIALLGEPIGTTLLAMLILRESPVPLELFGGGLILFGIYLAASRK